MRPLVIGEFHDAATTYTASQMQFKHFPHGSLLSWQGYRHGLPKSCDTSQPESADFMNGGYGANDCNNKLMDYLKTGDLPPTGYTCPIEGPPMRQLSLANAKKAVSEPKKRCITRK